MLRRGPPQHPAADRARLLHARSGARHWARPTSRCRPRSSRGARTAPARRRTRQHGGARTWTNGPDTCCSPAPASAQQRGPVALAGPTGRSAARLRRLRPRPPDGPPRPARPGLRQARERDRPPRLGSDAAARRRRSDDGVLVVSPEDAVWQTALLSGLEGGVVTADSALHRQPELAEPLPGSWRGPKPSPAPVPHGWRCGWRARSPSRRASPSRRVACFRHGIPARSLQHDVFDRGRRAWSGGRTSTGRSSRLLGEFDGRIKYGRLLREGESAERRRGPGEAARGRHAERPGAGWRGSSGSRCSPARRAPPDGHARGASSRTVRRLYVSVAG